MTRVAESSAVHLSPRERQILGLLADGCRGSELAIALELSPETIRTHIRNAMRKLGARTRVEAVTIAVELGLVARTPGSRERRF